MYVLVSFVYLNDEIDNYDFFWYISVQYNGFCCGDYYRDVELGLCKCKINEYVFIVFLFEILKYKQYYNVYV